MGIFKDFTNSTRCLEEPAVCPRVLNESTSFNLKLRIISICVQTLPSLNYQFSIFRQISARTSPQLFSRHEDLLRIILNPFNISIYIINLCPLSNITFCSDVEPCCKVLKVIHRFPRVPEWGNTSHSESKSLQWESQEKSWTIFDLFLYTKISACLSSGNNTRYSSTRTP